MSELKNAKIRGNPIDPDVLETFATIDRADIESAAEWWDEHASEEWLDALDSTPVDNP